jgi:hypothetical protein
MILAWVVTVHKVSLFHWERVVAQKRSQPSHRVQASATTNTYAYCRIAARNALEQAEAAQTGAFYFCMMAGVFASFTVEAFLNHLGLHHVSEWDALEKKLGPREKLILLKQLRKFTVDPSRRPFQSLTPMLRLRDALAHGKTVTVTHDRVISKKPQEDDLWPEPEWKKLCTVAMAKQMVEDAEAMVRDLHEQTGSKRDPFVGLGHAWSGESEVEEPAPRTSKK